MNKDDLQNFVSGMKYRETEERRVADEHLTRANAIQCERMKLEDYLYKCEQRDAKTEVR